MDLNRLLEPFKPEYLEYRIGRSGVKEDGGVWATYLVYVQARALQDRFDEVCGPLNWKVSYQFINESNVKGVLCEISIRTENGEWVTKVDGAEQTDIEPFKGGISGAFKRSAVTWGLARYLYDLPEEFADIVQKNTPGARYGKAKTKAGQETSFYWKPKPLPAWALPSEKDTQTKVQAANSNGHAQWTPDQKKEYCLKRWNITKYEALDENQKKTLLITSASKPYPEAIAELHQAGLK